MVTNRLSNFKEWLWSAKVFTTIVWIFLPLGFFAVFYPYFYTTQIEIALGMEEDKYYLERMFNLRIGKIILLAVLFSFSVFPAIYPSNQFFVKRGNVNAVIEYPYIRKVLFASVILVFILLISVIYLISPADNLTLGTILEDAYLTEKKIYEHNLGTGLGMAADLLAFVSASILLKLLLEHARKQFRFFYAKTCFEIINETKSETDKAEYLILGLNWYNKFVERVTKTSIDVETIYSKIVSHSQLSNNILLDTIMDSFHGGDELKPMRHMLALLACWKEGAALVKESLRTKIKESSDLLIPIVGVIVTILSSFFFRSGS